MSKIADEQVLSELTLCTPESGKLASKACIDRQCPDCGVKKIRQHLQPVLTNDGATKVKYQEWQRVEKKVKTKKKECITNVMELVTLEESFEELICKIEDELVKFSSHLFRAKWQQHQLKMTKAKLKPHSAVVIMDYAENYVCSSQDEIQSAHWVNQAVTIHPMMAFINASDEAGNTTHTEALICITSDLIHDADGVAHFVSTTYPYLQQKYGIQHVEEFSDCCAVQYRCAKSLADISFATNVSVNHNYFEASHGKSSADGLGAITKHAASMAVTRRQYAIKNAREFYEFCEKELTDVGRHVFPSQVEKYASSSRAFFYCENTNRDRPDRKREFNSM